MKSKTITGKVTYQDLGTGCWGIVDQKGNEWRAVNMPEQLKQDGKQVKVTVREVEEEASIFMWGTPVKVLSFTT